MQRTQKFKNCNERNIGKKYESGKECRERKNFNFVKKLKSAKNANNAKMQLRQNMQTVQKNAKYAWIKKNSKKAKIAHME